MTPDLQVRRGVTIPVSELSWRFSRASGPGGQSVNTTDSRVELSWDIGGSQALTDEQRRRLLSGLAGRLSDGVLTVAASEQRSQWQNRTAAQRRLVALVGAALAPPPAPRVPTKPRRSAVERRLAAKRRRGDLKQRRKPPTGAD